MKSFLLGVFFWHVFGPVIRLTAHKTVERVHADLKSE